jgi:predicted GH43/DUF377 family glycosyl hydrolase
MNNQVIRRYEGNPILTKHNVPWNANTVHNAGIVKVADTYVMLFRSHMSNGRSVIGKATSTDGYTFDVDPQPFIVPATTGDFALYEEYGVEDCRISLINGEYLLTYSAYSRHGVRVALAKTNDFINVERVSLITEADTRNVVIFPEMINDKYVRLDRPHSEISPWSIWISYSTDLIHWGESKVVIKPLPYHWDSLKIGPGAPPIKTERGWLNIYHGVFPTMSGAVYRLGVALHDLQNPAIVLGVSDDWILEPEDPWEISGYVDNVVFSCGAVDERNGKVRIYWGGADTVMCTGEADLDTLITLCLTKSRPPLNG